MAWLWGGLFIAAVIFLVLLVRGEDDPEKEAVTDTVTGVAIGEIIESIVDSIDFD